jgi:glycosyltransferase involved in cell wall biosynthesis
MLIDRYLPLWGGAENQLSQLLRRLPTPDIDTKVVTRRWKREHPIRETIDGVEVVRLGVPGTHIIAAVSYVAMLVLHLLWHRRRWDVIHTHGAALLGVLGTGVARVCRRRCVVKIATAGRITQRHRFGVNRLVWGMLRRADRVVALSREIEQELSEIDMPQDRTVSISNGVDTARFSPSAPARKRELRMINGIAPEGLVVLFSSRIVWRKGLDLALEAWNEIGRSRSNVHFYVAGSGRMQTDSNEAFCRDFVRRQSLSNVVFLDDVKDVAPILQCADIFLFPSRREGLPNAVLEAMAAALPVIATDIGGVQELIDHECTGLLFEKDSCKDLSTQLLRAIDDPRLRMRLASNARTAVVKNRSIEHTAATYRNLYSEVLQ